MDERRKAAYRYLLYQGVVLLRGQCGWAMSSPFDFWFSVRNLFLGRRVAYKTYWIADAFHNLAFYSARDFDGFVEEKFWNQLEHGFQTIGQAEHLESYQNWFAEIASGNKKIF